MLNDEQIKALVSALINKGGYNQIDAINAAKGPRANDLYKEFVDKNIYSKLIDRFNSKPADYDRALGYQCVDLMRFYVEMLFNKNAYDIIPAKKYAYQMFNDFKSNKYFEKVINNPRDKYQLAPRGAIMFWKPFVLGITGIGGHVGMVDASGVDTNIIFNQNYPTGRLCEFRKFGWRGVAGWLVPKI